MEKRKALSTQEVADMLHVSKSTIYGLIKKGEISSYTVGRKVRFSESDVQDYIARSKKNQSGVSSLSNGVNDFDLQGGEGKQGGFIICGQDLILDILSNYMRLHGVHALRAYIGSYDSLTSLYAKSGLHWTPIPI